MTFTTVTTFAVLLVVLQATVVPRIEPLDTHVPLTYKVQVKDDPKTRWAPVIRDNIANLQRFLEFVELIPTSKTFFDGVEHYAKTQFKYQDFVAEVQAIADLAQLPFDKLFFLNFMYEFSTIKACTAVLVRNHEGNIMHGRNLDFEMWEIFAKMLVRVDYYDGDKKLFTIDHVAGSVFALTG